MTFSNDGLFSDAYVLREVGSLCLELKRRKMMNAFSEKATSTWVLALASVASLMISLDSQVVSTALPTIRRSLGTSIEQLEWTVNAYSLSFAILLMTGAALGDRFGRRRIFVAGLGLFVVASAACALAPNVGWLIAARAVQGGGAALVMPLALTQLSAAFPPERRGRALGIFGSVTGLALLAGPVVGGAVAQGLAWQWIFWLNVPIGLLVIALVLSRIPESFGARVDLDMGGLVLVTGAALGVVWGLVRGNSAGWSSFEVVAPLAAGAGLSVAFVVWELRARADGADAVLPLPRLLSGHHSELLALRVDIRYPILFGAVPPNGAGLWTARCRAAPAPVDCHPVRGGTALRCPHQPCWRAFAHCPRAASASSWDGLDRVDRQARPPLCRTRCATDHRWLWCLDGYPHHPERGR